MPALSENPYGTSSDVEFPYLTGEIEEKILSLSLPAKPKEKILHRIIYH